MKVLSLATTFSLLLLSVKITAVAQADSLARKGSHLGISANYLSNAVYSGRKDSAAVPYFRPALGYYHKSGIYITAGSALLLNSSNPASVDAVTFNVGYDFNIGDKINAGLNIEKSFYTNSSYAVQSEIKGEGGIYMGYDANFVSINASSYMMYSTALDVSTTFGLSHSINLGKNDNGWEINPAVKANFGSQNFYQAYYSNRKYSANRGKGSSKKGGTSSSSSTPSPKLSFTTKSAYTILDYEITAPIKFSKKTWGLYLEPVYAMPHSPVTYLIDNRLHTEKLTNSFFVEIGGSVNF